MKAKRIKSERVIKRSLRLETIERRSILIENISLSSCIIWGGVTADSTIELPVDVDTT
jgi:hypothetical protein